MAKQVYYFGCIGQKGHFLWENEHSRIPIFQCDKIPFISREFYRTLDGKYCPEFASRKKKLSHSGPWLIISWWDNSVDNRPGSHSTFIGMDFKDFEEMLYAAKEKFPQVFARQGM